MSKKNNTNAKAISSSSEEEISEEQDARSLPILLSIDSTGKERYWKCWVVDNILYREYGVVGGKPINSERSFEGKSLGKKNETTPEEQAWAEANKEWIKHIDKEYLPADDDEEGQSLLENILSSKQKSGGHNINSVAASGGRATKNISRKKTDTCMVNEIEGGAVIPMKAEVWELEDESDPTSVLPKVAKYFSECTGKGKNLVMNSTEFYAQPKLDGWRCRVMIQFNKVTEEAEIVMTSNSGKQYPWFSSLRTLFKEWLTCSKIDSADLLDGLDGELYCDQFVDENGAVMDPLTKFSTVCSICGLSRSEPHPLEDQIQFHCFDLIDKSGTISQKDRFNQRNHLFKCMPQSIKNTRRIIKVETLVLDNIDKIPETHNSFVDLGYEGIVVRTMNMMYKCGKRSPFMRKVKTMRDEEYEIFGCKLDKGVSSEHFVWILKTNDGKEFYSKPMGTKEQKLEWYRLRKNYIGKFLTVKFQEFSEDGVPRFPIAKAIRAGKGTD